MSIKTEVLCFGQCGCFALKVKEMDRFELCDARSYTLHSKVKQTLRSKITIISCSKWFPEMRQVSSGDDCHESSIQVNEVKSTDLVKRDVSFDEVQGSLFEQRWESHSTWKTRKVATGFSVMEKSWNFRILSNIMIKLQFTRKIGSFHKVLCTKSCWCFSPKLWASVKKGASKGLIFHSLNWCLQNTNVIYKTCFQKSTICAEWIGMNCNYRDATSHTWRQVFADINNLWLTI